MTKHMLVLTTNVTGNSRVLLRKDTGCQQHQQHQQNKLLVGDDNNNSVTADRRMVW
jgi:hypothetical protein